MHKKPSTSETMTVRSIRLIRRYNKCIIIDQVACNHRAIQRRSPYHFSIPLSSDEKEKETSWIVSVS